MKQNAGVKGGAAPLAGFGAEPQSLITAQEECNLRMSVDRETVLRMAQAAQLRIAPEEVDDEVKSINDLLSICAVVGELDCADTPDFSWKMKKIPGRRDDVPEEWSGLEDFKAKAPAIDGDFFRVPRIAAEG